jgi:ketosteroid isomerase-like protein
VSQESIEVVLRGYRAFLAGDLETIADLLDPEIEWVGLEAEAAWPGIEHGDVLEVLAQRLEEGYRVELERCIGVGDQVVVSARFAGVEPDPEDERPLQSRRNYTVGRYSAIVTIRDGRVTRVEDYPHLSAALEAVGLEDEAH